jgi:metallo-beta-lactamase family protein
MANQEHATLQFLGAAGGVTGSKYLFSYGDEQVLIDCGLFH